MKVVEIFTTVQGEGKYIGTPSVFLRLGRCNLNCSGCDTKWDEYDELPAEEVAERIQRLPQPHLVITGGEPTLWQKDIAELLVLMASDKDGWKVVTVETNGAVPIRDEQVLRWVDLWSFSPKVGSLGADQQFKWVTVMQNIRRVPRQRAQVKYVLNPKDKEALARIVQFHSYLTAHRARPYDDMVFFQPYDTGTQVNVIDRITPFDLRSYSATLGELVEVIDGAFRSRFRVLPQLHKLLLEGGGLKAEKASAEARRPKK